MTTATDSFDVIKEFLARNPTPKKEEVREIFGALDDAYRRLLRVRKISPTVDYSDRMWWLLEAVGFENMCLRKPKEARK